MPITPSRQAAFRTLLKCERGHGSPEELRHAEPLSSADARLATELVYGVLRQRSVLDALIKRHCALPLEKLDLALLLALRLGAYQILFLSRVPKRAAVSESVEIVKQQKLRSAAGLANAVLRKITQEELEPFLQYLRLEEPSSLSLRYSHPRWLVERWIKRFGGQQVAKLLARNNQPPVVCFRLNSCALSEPALLEGLARAGVKAVPNPLGGGIWQVIEGDLSKTEAAGQHWVAIQDAAAQLVPRMVDPQPRDCCLDLCAAPGGKASLLAQLTQGQAAVMALDADWSRLQSARQLHGRQWPRIFWTVADGTCALPLDAQFDKILVDAPCSGTGTLGRNPDIRWRLLPEKLPLLQRRQRMLLENASRYLKPGGLLVYSTCSLEEEENQQVVFPFLDQHAEFALASPSRPELQRHFNDQRLFTLLPSENNADGFFAAILKKKAS